MSTYPIQHDTRLLDLYRELNKAEQQVAWAFNSLKGATRPRTARFERDDRRTKADVIGDAETLKAAGDERLPMYSKRPSELLGKYLDKVVEEQRVYVTIREHEQAYTGWQRFFLVTSSSGLVHSTMSCHTCNKGRKATTFALIPSFSGREVDGLVELVGPALCSVCFPAAPVEWTDAVRIPGRIAEYLLSLGEDEFRAELATYKTKQAAKAAKKGS